MNVNCENGLAGVTATRRVNPQKVALYGFAEGKKKFRDSALGAGVTSEGKVGEGGEEREGESGALLCNLEAHGHIHSGYDIFEHSYSSFSAGSSLLIAGNAPTLAAKDARKFLPLTFRNPSHLTNVSLSLRAPFSCD